MYITKSRKIDPIFEFTVASSELSITNLRQQTRDMAGLCGTSLIRSWGKVRKRTVPDLRKTNRTPPPRCGCLPNVSRCLLLESGTKFETRLDNLPNLSMSSLSPSSVCSPGHCVQTYQNNILLTTRLPTHCVAVDSNITKGAFSVREKPLTQNGKNSVDVVRKNNGQVRKISHQSGSAAIYIKNIWPEKDIFEKLANHRAAFFDISLWLFWHCF